MEHKETMLMSSKAHIGSASRSSTDLSYFNREVKHRAREVIDPGTPPGEFSFRGPALGEIRGAL